MKRYSTDMLHGALLPSIIRYTIPIILSGLLQLLFNAMDLIIVGRFCGSLSIAAVSATGSLTNLLVCLVSGLSVGVGVCISHALGANEQTAVHRAVHTAVLTSMICGIIMSVIGVFLSAPLLELMGTPSDIRPLSTTYMQIYFGGIFFSIVYNFVAFILRANGDTKGPLIYLTCAGVLNVVLNIFFVTVFHMDVAGVALATVISYGLSAALALRALMRRTDCSRLELKKLRIYKAPLLKIIQIGVPAGIQSALFNVSNVFIQSAINSFDNSALISGCGAAGNLEGFVYTSMNAFQQTTVNYVGQNVGAHQFDRVKRITLLCMGCVTVVGLAMSTLIYCNGSALLSIYISDSKDAIEYGLMRMVCICMPYFLCGLMEVTTGALRGMGASLLPMLISVLGVCALRILWIATIFQIPEFHTPDVVYLSYPVTWIITLVAQLIAFFIIYKRRIDANKRNTAAHA